MASTRSKRPATPRKPARSDGRRKSLLTQVGDRAAFEAKRKFLLAALREHRWNLSRTAEAMGMEAGASAVIQAIRSLDLGDEYEAARKRGDVAPGRPT